MNGIAKVCWLWSMVVTDQLRLLLSDKNIWSHPNFITLKALLNINYHELCKCAHQLSRAKRSQCGFTRFHANLPAGRQGTQKPVGKNKILYKPVVIHEKFKHK